MNLQLDIQKQSTQDLQIIQEVQDRVKEQNQLNKQFENQIKNDQN